MSEALSSSSPQVMEKLESVFGHREYRAGQAPVLDSVLSARPTLAILPTGGGKSLCYQLPALLLDGLTLVVSPLIALIRDQVAAMQELGIRASSLTSADEHGDRVTTYRALAEGELDLLYVAPERLRSPAFLDRLSSANVSLIAIDEAHCISQWGHDFRPDYARLGELIENVAPPRVLALTATATAEVREDIVASLKLADARTIVSGFDRPNLELSVKDRKGISKKLHAVGGVLERWLGRSAGEPGPGCGIVYAATRKRTEEVADGLADEGWQARAYHAGLVAERRSEVQDAFRGGTLDVVVATTAFGMGVDKADVRAVIHFDIPSSPESYYQEVGRAGRDGEPAAGVLLYDPSDLRWAFMRLESSCPTAAAVDRAFSCLSGWSEEGMVRGSFDEVVERIEGEIGPSARAALVTLDRGGAVRIGLGGVEVAGVEASFNRAALDRRERVERGKLEAMMGYVTRASCRRRFLVDYFGDPDRPDRCGTCDRCALPDARALDGDNRTDVLKTLSCVARMRGRYGRGRVVDTLLGKRSKPVLAAGLDRLSTYGLLERWSKEEMLALLDSLSRASLVAQTPGEYPKLQLTEDGAAVLRDGAAVEIDLRLSRWGDDVPELGAKAKAKAKAKKRKARSDLPAPGGPLFDSFREWRAEVAKRIGKPPYVVAHDALLSELVERRPASLSELAEVPGIGPAKLQAYGSDILAILDENPAP